MKWFCCGKAFEFHSKDSGFTFFFSPVPCFWVSAFYASNGGSYRNALLLHPPLAAANSNQDLLLGRISALKEVALLCTHLHLEASVMASLLCDQVAAKLPSVVTGSISSGKKKSGYPIRYDLVADLSPFFTHGFSDLCSPIISNELAINVHDLPFYLDIDVVSSKIKENTLDLSLVEYSGCYAAGIAELIDPNSKAIGFSNCITANVAITQGKANPDKNSSDFDCNFDSISEHSIKDNFDIVWDEHKGYKHLPSGKKV